MRLVLSTIVLLMLAANPCFAKDGHAQHGARASATNNAASGKGAADKGASGKGAISTGASKGASATTVNPAETKSLDLEATVPPSELPPHSAAQQGNRNANLKLKIVPPRSRPHNVPAGAATTAPTARNAIGQPIVQSKISAVAQPHALPALQEPATVPSPIGHGAPIAPPAVSASPARPSAPAVNVANVTNRGSVNGATVVRPATGPSVIGGPAQARYGINGTTVQNRR